MSTIRAVIFDLYGVLGLNGWQEFKRRHFSDAHERWEPLRQLGQRVDAGEATEDEFVAALAAETGEDPAHIRYQFDHTQPNRALLDFIRTELSPHYKIGLLSNASRDTTKHLFSEADRALFSSSLLSAHVGLTKPGQTMFLMMCEQLGVRPEECVMVDDQERHLATARTLGMKTVRYETFEQAVADIRKVLLA
jgi:putative hydrolase of the HAD superfamily